MQLVQAPTLLTHCVDPASKLHSSATFLNLCATDKPQAVSDEGEGHRKGHLAWQGRAPRGPGGGGVQGVQGGGGNGTPQRITFETTNQRYTFETTTNQRTTLETTSQRPNPRNVLCLLLWRLLFGMGRGR